jgi:CRP/FNR family cyclic AMP-dependent transcriptional regulator
VDKAQPNLEILNQVSLFSDLKTNAGAVEALLGLMKQRDFAAGETILTEGELGSDFYILAEGDAGVYKKTQDGDPYKVANLHGHTGTFFGEAGLLDADTRTATIRAETNCKCLVLSRGDFEAFAKSHPDWALPILKRVAVAIMARLKKMNHDLGMLYKALVDEFAQR